MKYVEMPLSAVFSQLFSSQYLKFPLAIIHIFLAQPFSNNKLHLLQLTGVNFVPYGKKKNVNPKTSWFIFRDLKKTLHSYTVF